jgi:hypothetical protein
VRERFPPAGPAGNVEQGVVAGLADRVGRAVRVGRVGDAGNRLDQAVDGDRLPGQADAPRLRALAAHAVFALTGFDFDLDFDFLLLNLILGFWFSAGERSEGFLSSPACLFGGVSSGELERSGASRPAAGRAGLTRCGGGPARIRGLGSVRRALGWCAVAVWGFPVLTQVHGETVSRVTARPVRGLGGGNHRHGRVVATGGEAGRGRASADDIR